MNILVTGSKGFVGKNFICALKNIRDGKDRSYPQLRIDEIFEYDIDSPRSLLETACARADIVFNFAGVNRPEDKSEFMKGNCGFAGELLDLLKKNGNTCPVMLSSSVQASLEGRYNSDYGVSKRACEELFIEYFRETGAQVLIYRLPNLFGKWCRPNYNSVVATFCYNVANDLPIRINDENTSLTLLYIDDLVDQLIKAALGKVQKYSYDGKNEVNDENGCYCRVFGAHKVTLGEIADMLKEFASQPDTLIVPEIPSGSFKKKLYSTYLSYLPKEKAIFSLKMNSDPRGSFTELIKTAGCGQFSVNVSKPGITKGQHWHNSKWELFVVVYGKALIRMRQVDSDEVIEYCVSGDRLEAVHMLPGYTHSIENVSDTDELITFMWANEPFDPEAPDTFALPV